MGKKTGENAKKANDKCPFCKGKLTDDNHKNKISEGGRNTRDGNFANQILAGNEITQHGLYEEGHSPQAHHLISVSAMKKYGKQCRAIGYNINCKENCVFLPQSPAKACQYAIQRHDGVHLKTYFSAVKSLVNGVFRNFNEKKCEDFENKKKAIIQELNEKSQTILDNIMNFSFLLQKDSLNYLSGSTIGCSAVLKSGKNKEVLEDKRLKKSVREIEAERKETADLIRSVIGNSDEVTKTQNEFEDKTSQIASELQCSCGRLHGLLPLTYTLTVGNAS